VAIWCDVALEVKAEFDDWHAHEHQPERLSIPGFLRGSRSEAIDGSNRYFMCYETEDERTVTTGAYLERLNNPTPWSRRMMPHHQNMVRSLCRVQASYGAGFGRFVRTARFSPGAGQEAALERRLGSELAGLPSQKGIVAAHFLRRVEQGFAQTAEQKLRGGDRSADWIVLLNGYDADALAAVDLGDAVSGIYSLACLLTPADLQARR
jgi:hypothetical protein